MKKTKNKKNIFNIFYDKEADVLYASLGKASSSDKTSETKDEVVIRKDAKTGKVKGFTILNFLKRGLHKTSINLPFQIALK